MKNLPFIKYGKAIYNFLSVPLIISTQQDGIEYIIQHILKLKCHCLKLHPLFNQLKTVVD